MNMTGGSLHPVATALVLTTANALLFRSVGTTTSVTATVAVLRHAPGLMTTRLRVAPMMTLTLLFRLVMMIHTCSQGHTGALGLLPEANMSPMIAVATGRCFACLHVGWFV